MCQIHKQSQFTSKFIPTSWYFFLIGSGKKSNFAGFLGANSQKNRPILLHFSGNVCGKLCRKSIGKNGRFCGYFLEKILSDIDRFCIDQTSVFNDFLTEVIICSFNNNTLQKWTNGKALTSWLMSSFSQHNLRLVVSGHYLHVLVMKYPDKFASLRQVNSPNSCDKFLNFALFCVFLWRRRREISEALTMSCVIYII